LDGRRNFSRDREPGFLAFSWALGEMKKVRNAENAAILYGDKPCVDNASAR
jgi:hypothetical protein